MTPAWNRKRREPTEQDIADHDRRALYAHVFGSFEGQRVLDDIVQRVCCVDTRYLPQTPQDAFRFIERRNVGLEIADLALGVSAGPTKPEVKHG